MTAQLNNSIAGAESLMRATRTKLKRAEPKDMLPQLHQKTHFRAAMEYSIGSADKKLTQRLQPS